MSRPRYIPNFGKLFLNVTETAYWLNCSSGKVYQLIHSHKLPAVRHGREYRILADDVLGYAHNCARA